jgi:hypothetical protein
MHSKPGGFFEKPPPGPPKNFSQPFGRLLYRHLRVDATPGFFSFLRGLQKVVEDFRIL